MRVGFTGTRDGMSGVQLAAVGRVFTNLSYPRFSREPDPMTLHHGDCVGADAQAHQLALDRAWDLIGHPPDDPKHRAYCADYTRVHDPLPYLERNERIVEATQILIAAPNGPERQRSGTWFTIRYARRAGRPIVIVWPTGHRTREEGARDGALPS